MIGYPDILRAKILVVDDNPANVAVLEQMLSGAGYVTVSSTTDSQTVCALHRQHQFDLILLDLNMPGLDGFAVMRLLKDIDEGGYLPVLAITAEPGHKLRALRAGAKDFVSRPFDLGEVLMRVQNMLEVRLIHLGARRLNERLLAEQTISEQRLLIFRSSPGATSLTDLADGRIIDVNAEYCSFFGYSREEIIGRKATDLNFWADPADRPAMLALVRERGALRGFAVKLRRRSGEVRQVLGSYETIQLVEENRPVLISIFTDITERRRLDEHFLQAQKMEALGQFSGGVAHDFNNILAAISGFTELSQLLLQGNPEVRAHLTSILLATGRATDLVRQILTFSRQQPQERHAIQLQPVLAESIKLMRATISSSVVFDLKVGKDAPAVLANANQVQQVLMNLGANAAHAMRARPGRLGVSLERYVASAPGEASETRLAPGLYARLSVSDSGCGMDVATRRRIFDPFFTTKPLGEGTGLGLAVVHGIMAGHDGLVTVDSRLGEGTTFHLYFPAYQGAPAAAEPAAAPVQMLRGLGQRILLVDDEAVLVQMGRHTLMALGYEVEGLTQPLAALALFQADPERIALAVLDHTMPALTGLQLACRLKEIRPNLPIILMTGNSSALTPEQIRTAGICQVLNKPADLRRLATAVHSHLT